MMALYLGLLLFSFSITCILIVPFINLLFKLKFLRQDQKTKDFLGKRTPIFDKFHKDKAGIPIGGGIIIILVVFFLYLILFPILKPLGVYISTLYPMADELNVLFFTFISFGILGLYDDLMKFFGLAKQGIFGLRMRHKFLIQWVLAIIIGLMLFQNLKINFVKQDARNLSFSNEFDIAIMLCEGGFPLMETDEMNYEILNSVTKSLREHGKFIFTTLNGLFPLYHSVKEFCASTTEEGNATYRSNTFDLMTFRDHNVTEFEDDFGNKKILECNERYYVPSEISWMLKSLGYKKIDIYGAKLGAFSRNDKLTTEDFEMLVIAKK